MSRTTRKQLEILVGNLNGLAGENPETYGRQPDGSYRANVGTYCLESAYGGYQSGRLYNDAGAISQPLGGGFYPAGQMADLLHAYMRGMEAGMQIVGSP